HQGGPAKHPHHNNFWLYHEGQIRGLFAVTPAGQSNRSTRPVNRLGQSTCPTPAFYGAVCADATGLGALMRHVLRLALIFSFLAFAGRAAAQAVPDRLLHGTVLDTSRAPVVGVRVVASPDGPGTGLTAVTDARGEFSLALGPGSYDITISAPGFVPYVQRLAATKA